MVDVDRVTEMVGLSDRSGVGLPEGTHIEQIRPGRIRADFGDEVALDLPPRDGC